MTATTTVQHLRFLAENYGDSEDAADFAAAADMIEELQTTRRELIDAMSDASDGLHLAKKSLAEIADGSPAGPALKAAAFDVANAWTRSVLALGKHTTGNA